MKHSKDHGNFAHPVTAPTRNPEDQAVSPGLSIRAAPCRRQPPEVRDAGRIRFGAALRRPTAK